MFQQAGFEVVHTLDLPLGNRTSDTTINELSTKESLIVVTKDEDFVDSFILRRQPWKLLPATKRQPAVVDLYAELLRADPYRLVHE